MTTNAEVLEGSSREDETLHISIFPRLRRGIFHFFGLFEVKTRFQFLGFPAFFSAISRMRLLSLFFEVEDEGRNFALFLGHFEIGTRTMRTSELVQNEKIELL